MVGRGSTPPDGGAAWVLGDAATVCGLRLAGLRGRVVSSPAEVRAALAELQDAGAALVVLTDVLCEALGGPATLIGAEVRPIVAVIPSATHQRVGSSPAAQIARAVRRALGISSERRAEEH